MTALSGRGRAWRTLRARVVAEELACGICGREVDKALSKAHPSAPQVDHLIPVSVAPELTMVRSNLRLVHRVCNLRRGVPGRKRQSAPGPASSPVFGPLSSSNPSRTWGSW